MTRHESRKFKLETFFMNIFLPSVPASDYKRLATKTGLIEKQNHKSILVECVLDQTDVHLTDR